MQPATRGQFRTVDTAPQIRDNLAENCGIAM
jgi:hypothetical protein